MNSSIFFGWYCLPELLLKQFDLGLKLNWLLFKISLGKSQWFVSVAKKDVNRKTQYFHLCFFYWNFMQLI